ncbi:MAG TPA: hypothetical protein VGF31_01330 [Myxococcaceae bacterium]
MTSTTSRRTPNWGTSTRFARSNWARIRSSQRSVCLWKSPSTQTRTFIGRSAFSGTVSATGVAPTPVGVIFFA